MSIIKITGLSVRQYSKNILNHISFEVCKNEHWAISGPSGSGKTTLLHALCGRQFHSGRLDVATGISIVMVEQQHRFRNLSNTSGFYYQQRFNSYDSEDTLTVKEYLESFLSASIKITSGLMKVLDIDAIWDRKLIQLSNGENKRLQIAKALLLQPQLLLLDNPFTGLDVKTRQALEELLVYLTRQSIHIIIVTSAQMMPSFVSHVLELNEEGKGITYKKDDYVGTTHSVKQKFQLDTELLQQLSTPAVDHEFENAVFMNNVCVRYGNKEILKNLSWHVKEGEHWALTGPNGAGKSTLLSLITGDNPQAYANEIFLFDKRRGSGESIWDIKKRIGYVSPELHLYFPSNVSVFEAIASGLFDTIGLFRQLSETQIKWVTDWINLFGIQSKGNRLLNQLSASEQRLTLLARALIKNPSLLILDEPAQGLDAEQSAVFKDMVDLICMHTTKTLIYVSHWQEELPRCVDHFVRLEAGEIVSCY